jgi:predicted RNA binding protein YcfA (HicA-like mRNA interferase family)
MSHRKHLCQLLEKQGYVLIRSNNHFVYRNSTGNTVIVPNHNKMNENTFRSIIKKVGKAA